MKATHSTSVINGPAGVLECAIDEAPNARGVAVLAHPHPLMGGTMDNKVVHTLARACVALGLKAVRFNFRGVGQSSGAWDEGRGEVDDLLAVIQHFRIPGQALVVGGFSFGGFAASQATQRLSQPAPSTTAPMPGAGSQAPDRLLLVGPAAGRFEVSAVDTARTLVIHGEADEVVPLAAVLDWARPQSLPVIVVPGVGHFFHGQLTLLKDLVMRDLRASLPPANPLKTLP